MRQLIVFFCLIFTLLSCGSSESDSGQEIALKRYCFACDLKNDPELIAAYKELHTPDGMWPEIPVGIKAAGVIDMEIFLTGTRMFLVTEIPAELDIDSVWTVMGEQARQDEWQEFVWQFQQALPDAAPGEKWRAMEKIYDLDDYW